MSVWLQQLQDTGSSITGALQKAVLCVPRVHFEDAGNNLNAGMLKQLEGFEEGSSAVASMAAARLESSMRSGTFAASSFQQLQKAAGSDYCTMRVQYNPARMTFTSTAESVHDGGMGDAGTNDNTQIASPPETSMTVNLIFDAVNVKDAFQWEKYRLSLNDAVQGATALFQRHSYQVDKQVNALLALTVHGAVRHVVFHWSNLTFSGELTNVTANYTMFNPGGRPVRADVELTIKQKYETYDKEKEGYWESAYGKMFGGRAEDTVTQGKSKLDAAQSLFHLNI